jgi:hypothetical protein
MVLGWALVVGVAQLNTMIKLTRLAPPTTWSSSSPGERPRVQRRNVQYETVRAGGVRSP